MKKSLSILIATVLSLSLFAGCGSKTEPKKEGEKTPVTDTKKEEAGIAKLGLGLITTIGKSKDLGVDKNGKEVLPVGQVDTVIVAAGFDKDGKIVKVTIDTAQTKVNYEKDLKIKSDVKAPIKTKVELKEDYKMKGSSKIGKEWYEQIAELEKWMIGKTVEEVKAMKVKKVDDSHTQVPDIAELTSTVTIDVGGYVAALEEAYKNAVEIKEGAVKVGLGNEVSMAKSKALGVDKNGKEVLPVAQVDTTVAATAFDKDGKVVATIIDVAQTKVNFSKEGKVTSDKTVADVQSKKELKEKYNMKGASKIGKEWFEQAAEFEKWMAGKSIEDIKALKTKKVDDNHTQVPDVAELTSSVTIDIGGYRNAVVESLANAK